MAASSRGGGGVAGGGCGRGVRRRTSRGRRTASLLPRSMTASNASTVAAAVAACLFLMVILGRFGLGQAQTSTRLEGEGTGSPCYEVDENGEDDLTKPKKCMPEFTNVVYNMMVNVTPEHVTCGLRSRTDYCIQTHGVYRECDYCDAQEEEKRHPPEYLTDLHEDFDATWWQSITMVENLHYQDVNLTVNLGKAYDVTYVRLKFHSPRPASFAIFKKSRINPGLPDENPEEGWIPWQYYSVSCMDRYDTPDSTSIIQPRDRKIKIAEDRALCTSEYSDMTPLTGANVAFSTLEGRPSAFNFEYSPELQQWVSATDLRISLHRLNTFGDELFGDDKVLRSYYYAITDFTVGGRCQCNGHAKYCVENENSTAVGPLNNNMICLCMHNTAGPNCETCLPDHWDVRWQRASTASANECKACECNRWSNRCRFNEQLYQETGRGGECMDCEGYRDGPNCEVCKPNHYFSHTPDALGRTPCEPCNCDPTGSKSLQCAPDGQCDCKPGVTGPKCDMCEPTHWDFTELGCKDCGCRREGSLDNEPNCDALDGQCYCKQNVEGQRCQKCAAGHFHIDEGNEFGCTPCFCYGHTSECSLSGGYTQAILKSDFSRGSEDWTAVEGDQSLSLQYDTVNKLIRINSNIMTPENGYFLAPPLYLGDQRASYNQELKFTFQTTERGGVRPSFEDIVIEGGGAKATRITLSITDQNNTMPDMMKNDYTFRLHENPKFGWNPRLSAKDYIAILANITAIRIRGTYGGEGQGLLDEVKLGTAERGGTGPPATWIERCECPEGYQGQFCQLCKPGYYHENNGGPFARCVPCSCNSHADICDSETGECECKHDTAGHNCERCAKGFYGNALLGLDDDCSPCPCPDGGACIEVQGNPDSPICTECPTGRTGPRCELCEDGYFGDPMGQNGPIRACTKCDCNNNVDANAIGNCNRTTGECLRCVDSTDGFNCERCKSGFFGDALALKQPGDPPSCQPCQCYPIGTNLDEETTLPICNGYTGDCLCKPHVIGRNCEKCADGYFNLESGEGCEPCNCDAIGSLNATCHVQTGQCNCREGVTGQRCDMCLPFHYGFSPEGCKLCDCDPSGSTDMQCDLISGQCPCRDKVEGRKCDRCMENTRSKDTGGFGEKICEPCDDCYNLVQDAADEHRQSLENLDALLQKIAENPEPVGNDFEYEMTALNVKVKSLLADTKLASRSEDGDTLRDRLQNLRTRLQDVVDLIVDADGNIMVAKDQGQEVKRDVSRVKVVIQEARTALKSAQRELETQGREALRRAEERSKKFGEESTKMSEIAREARTLAEQQVEDASEISSIAKQAYDISSEAYNMARDAMEQQHFTAQKIQVLEVDAGAMGKKLMTVQSLATQTLRDSTDAYNQALNILQQAKSLEVPTVDHATLEDQAVKVNRDARRIQEEAQRLISENEELLLAAQDKRVELEDLLNRAENQQQQVDRQLADMDGYNKRALEAVQSGNNVLKDAQDTLRTLQDFETRVTENKESARAALANVESIEEMIRQAGEKTQQASQAMNGADSSANLALTVALDAQKIAEEASEKAAVIGADSATSLEQANALASDAQGLADKLTETKEQVGQKEEIAKEDGDSALQALSKANQAQIKSKEATRKVEQAKKELEDIAAILATVQEPEPGLLNELSRRVEAAEREFVAQDLDQKLRDLEAAKQRQISRVRDMERELNYLREESENILTIRDSLPNFCPKSTELCLEDQC